MGIFLLMAMCGCITLEDLQDYLNDMLNVKEVTLGRMNYFVCTWLVSVCLAALSVIVVGIAGVNLSGPKTLGYYVALLCIWAPITLVQISAFMRRMNDAMLTKWFTLVFLVPGIGNILAFLIAMMPTGFGDPYS